MSTALTHSVDAKFPCAPKDEAEFVTDLRQIVNNAKKSSDWDTSPQVQAAINALSADADDIEKNALELDQLRKQLSKAEQAQVAKVIESKQHRKHAEAAITVASKGSALAVKGWGCEIASRTRSTPTEEAPQNVVAKNGQSPGDVVVRCRGVRAKAYLFQYAHDPAFPEGSPTPVILPTGTYTLTGLPPGQRVFFRVAVIRHITGQSKWSEAVQLTVR